MLRKILAVVLLSGCSIQVKPDPEVEKALQQHSIVLNAVVEYIKQCQEKGICPKPEPEKK